MTKKIFCLLFFVLATFFLTTSVIFADDCDFSQCDPGNEDCLNKIKNLCSKQVVTYDNQIKILTSQYELAQLKITQTENSIKGLEQEINNLSVEIDKLNIQLDDLSQLFIYQTAQNYKNQKKAPLFFFLLKANLNDFLQQNQYVSSVRQNNQENLIKMGTIKERYDIQKTAKTKKQQDMETLQKTLASQKKDLAKQKADKDQLLKISKQKYQQIINQLASLNNTNTSCLSGPAGTGKDGNYFSQIDGRWCTNPIGPQTKYTIGGAGCYLTSMCMVLKKIGYNITPFEYASDIDRFTSTADLAAPQVPSGYTYKKVIGYKPDIIDSELKNNRYVIAQVPMRGSPSGSHFIVIISGSNGNYKIHDPVYGADKDFDQYYSTSKIISLRLITK